MTPERGIVATADGVLGSPVRLLGGTLIFVMLVFALATLAYVAGGWSVGDAAYMVTLTVFSVGFSEVHAVTSPYLRFVTIATIIFGCTGMIVLTGALVQVFTLYQLRTMLGINRMQTQIDRLVGHVVICGFGRIGVQLAKELQGAGSGFVVIERDARKVADAQALGYLCIAADATDEDALARAGLARARVLATVLPDDAANVFITLSARSLSDSVEIIARGEAPTTESKLIHAGANKVVLPTHIGAERMAAMILYPATDGIMSGSPQMADTKRGLRDLGLDLEAVTVAADSAMTGETVKDAELRGHGAYFIVQIDRAGGQQITHPGYDVHIEAGDTVILVVRRNRIAAGAAFAAPRPRVRAGRSAY